MESIFCSSGITASGVAGIEPDDQPFGGFTIAKLLYTANEEPVRAPSLGFGTAHTKKAGGDKKATELFLLLRIIHPPDLPDRPACQGVWFLEPHQIIDYFKVVTAAFRQAVKKMVERAPRSYVLVTFWQDIIPGACFEPSTSLTSCPSGPILEQSDDVDAGYISGYIRNDGGIITFYSVAFDLTVEDLVDKLPDDLANWILEMDPAPASGLVPLQASTGIIEHGVIRRNHQNIRLTQTHTRTSGRQPLVHYAMKCASMRPRVRTGASAAVRSTCWSVVRSNTWPSGPCGGAAPRIHLELVPKYPSPQITVRALFSIRYSMTFVPSPSTSLWKKGMR